jgi:hypothetical protein
MKNSHSPKRHKVTLTSNEHQQKQGRAATNQNRIENAEGTRGNTGQPPSRPDGRHQGELKTPAGEKECPPTRQRRGAVAGRGRWSWPQARRRVRGRGTTASQDAFRGVDGGRR